MKKNILLWGCISSPWTVSFVNGFLLKYNYDVWILGTRVQKEFEDSFRKNGIHIIESPQKVIDWYKEGQKGSFLKTIYMYFLQIKAVVKAGDYDIINLQYVEGFDIILVSILKAIKKAKLVLSYWGSDLLRISDSQLRWEGALVKHADYISVENGDLKNKFEKTYKWAKRVKLETVYFGLPVLEIIMEKQEKQGNAQIRENWKIPKHKKVVAVGHNAVPQQQHIKVLKVIENLDETVKKDIFLLLQMTYGDGGEYKRQVINAVEKTGCEYLVIEHYLTDDEIADLRTITDIFIHAQTTDAFSGSVCENLFSGTILINAKWLRYQEFNDYDFKYIEFDSMDEIGEKITEVLQFGFDVFGNKELIWKLRSWRNCSLNWERIYQKVLENNEKGISHRC